MPFELPAYRFCLERLELLGDAAGSPNGELVSFDGTMEWVKQTLWGSLNASQLFTFFVGPKFWMFRVVTNLKSIRSWKFMFRMYKSMIFTNKNIPVLYWRCVLDVKFVHLHGLKALKLMASVHCGACMPRASEGELSSSAQFFETNKWLRHVGAPEDEEMCLYKHYMYITMHMDDMCDLSMNQMYATPLPETMEIYCARWKLVLSHSQKGIQYIICFFLETLFCQHSRPQNFASMKLLAMRSDHYTGHEAPLLDPPLPEVSKQTLDLPSYILLYAFRLEFFASQRMWESVCWICLYKTKLNSVHFVLKRGSIGKSEQKLAVCRGWGCTFGVRLGLFGRKITTNQTQQVSPLQLQSHIYHDHDKTEYWNWTSLVIGKAC